MLLTPLDLLRAFRDELARSSTLTVVGYSFRDPHINVYVSQWLNSDRGHVLRIVNGPGFVAQPVEYVRDLLALRRDHPSQVEIIDEFAGAGLRTLYGPYVGSFDRPTPEENPEAKASTTDPDPVTDPID